MVRLPSAALGASRVSSERSAVELETLENGGAKGCRPLHTDLARISCALALAPLTWFRLSGSNGPLPLTKRVPRHLGVVGEKYSPLPKAQGGTRTDVSL